MGMQVERDAALEDYGASGAQTSEDKGVFLAVHDDKGQALLLSLVEVRALEGLARNSARASLRSKCLHAHPHVHVCVHASLAGLRAGKRRLTQGCAPRRACDITQVCSTTGAFFCRGRCTHIKGLDAEFIFAPALFFEDTT